MADYRRGIHVPLKVCRELQCSQLEVVVETSSPKYVNGLSGIAQLFGCSIPIANRIKKSGKVDKAIKQIGRKIIVDTELILELAGLKTGGRR